MTKSGAEEGKTWCRAQLECSAYCCTMLPTLTSCDMGHPGTRRASSPVARSLLRDTSPSRDPRAPQRRDLRREVVHLCLCSAARLALCSEHSGGEAAAPRG